VEPQSQRSPTLASQRPALMRPTGMDRRRPDNGSKAGAADLDAWELSVGSGAPCSEGERSFGVLDSAWGPDERVVDELANLSVSSEESSGLSLGSAARATHTERSESDGLLHMLLSKIEALESELRGRAVPTPDIPAAEAKSGASAAGAGGHVICVDTHAFCFRGLGCVCCTSEPAAGSALRRSCEVRRYCGVHACGRCRA
jgi:hypothetical protein